MSKSFENFSDVRIYSPNKKEYRAHSCVLKQRCNYLFKKILKKENEQIVFSLICITIFDTIFF